MHGDFSRLTYTTAPLDTDRGFAAVLSLQGRLPLEADANENVAILAHFLRTLVTDLIGPGAGPAPDPGFHIMPNDGDLTIGDGHYYVGGLLVQTAETSYLTQPNLHVDDDLQEVLNQPMIAYLKVWERLITAIEDPSIREVALGAWGPDTAARSKVVWQVLLAPAPERDAGPPQNREQAMELWAGLEETLRPATQGRLRARVLLTEDEDDLCALSPDARYRGVENQLYRVEIHSVGEIGGEGSSPTFKWSRDNGSVVFPIEARTNEIVTVATLGRDDRLALDIGDWVEIVDDRYTLSDKPGELRQVEDINTIDRLVTLDNPPSDTTGTNPELHPFLRRWDQHPDAKERGTYNAITANGYTWMNLEDGIQVKFEPGSYQRGDFWTIPARVETSDIIWPDDRNDGSGPAARQPEGVRFFYAPLTYLPDAGQVPIDMRCIFPTLGCQTKTRPQDKQGEHEPKPRPAHGAEPSENHSDSRIDAMSRAD